MDSERIGIVLPAACPALAMATLFSCYIRRSVGRGAGGLAGPVAENGGAVGLQCARIVAGGIRSAKALSTDAAVLRSEIPASICLLRDSRRARLHIASVCHRVCVGGSQVLLVADGELDFDRWFGN